MNSRLMLLGLVTALFAAAWAGDGRGPRAEVALTGTARYVTRAVSAEPRFRLLAVAARTERPAR